MKRSLLSSVALVVLLLSGPVRVAGQEATLLLGGDVMLANWVVDHMDRSGRSYPFRAMQEVLSTADIRFCNLEAPIGTAFDEDRVEKTYTFALPPEYRMALADGGFDVVSLANNHILDYGPRLADSTQHYLTEMGIRAAGYGQTLQEAAAPVYVERGITVAFLAYSMTYPGEYWASDSTAGTAYPFDRVFEPVVAQADSLADFTVVSFHWGSESSDSTQKYQQVYAHRAIDAGADLIVGHHPHVWQGLEWYNNRLIAYSLGNLCFGSFSETATESGLLQVRVAEDTLLNARIHPLDVNNVEVRFQPRPLAVERGAGFLEALERYSARFDTISSVTISREGMVEH